MSSLTKIVSVLGSLVLFGCGVDYKNDRKAVDESTRLVANLNLGGNGLALDYAQVEGNVHVTCDNGQVFTLGISGDTNIPRPFTCHKVSISDLTIDGISPTGPGGEISWSINPGAGFDVGGELPLTGFDVNSGSIALAPVSLDSTNYQGQGTYMILSFLINLDVNVCTSMNLTGCNLGSYEFDPLQLDPTYVMSSITAAQTPRFKIENVVITPTETDPIVNFDLVCSNCWSFEFEGSTYYDKRASFEKTALPTSTPGTFDIVIDYVKGTVYTPSGEAVTTGWMSGRLYVKERGT